MTRDDVSAAQSVQRAAERWAAEQDDRHTFLSGQIEGFKAGAAWARTWRLIETAPKDCAPIMVSDGTAVGEAQYYADEDGWWWAGSHPTDAHDGRVRHPTHWMPLPPPPATKDGGEGC